MKYAIILLILLILIFIAIIKHMKNNSYKSKNLDDEIFKEKETVIKDDPNKNPAFEVTLIDYKKAQLGIYKSGIRETVNFKKQKDKRIKVYNNSEYIGLIAIKDYKNFDLIATHPNFFEGKIKSYAKQDNGLTKITISVKVKIENSRDVYNINNDYLHSLISIHSLFEIGQIIESSYGPSTITEILDDHLIVDVPSLGKREIYNIKDMLTK